MERSAAPGQKLVAQVPMSLFGDHTPVLSPALVRQCVELALARGFDPDAPKGQHPMWVSAGELDFARVNRDELTKRPLGRPRKRAVGEKRKPVYVSLEPGDRARLEALAAKRGIGLGTLARTWILERMNAEEEGV
jgi:hypothetical protein